ncbi:MAG: hypothetical protein A2035_05370 [Nitrospirae bacterium GWA2_42_11]|nr:MAG: hypothetical protein A2035_05370 [Nitrospirae bacterium GWA2_42_11]
MNRLFKLISSILFLTFPVFYMTVSHASDDFRKRAPQVEETFTEDDDIRAEIVFGRELAARIIGKYGIYKNNDITQYVNMLGKGLSQYTNRPELEFRFAVLDTDSINAFAAPGGYIFITKGALKAIEDEAELAGVLAHEIAHVSERHIVKELDIKGKDESTVANIGRIIGGNTEFLRGVFTQMVDEAADILFEKGFKKQDEIDADRIATLIITTAGYDPSALSRYLKKISSDEKEGKTIGSTHPLFSERIEKIDTLLVDNNLVGKKYEIVKERFHENVRLR